MLAVFIFTSVLAEILIPLTRHDSFINSSNPSSPRFLSASSDYTLLNRTSYYTGSLKLGSPGTTFNFMISTTLFVKATQVTWLESTDCSPCRGFANQFNSKVSSTYNETNTNLIVYYLSYMIQGVVGKDIFNFGESNVLSTESYFLLASSDSGFGDEKLDGCLGFALNIYSLNYSTFMDSLQSSGLISKRIFAIYLNYFSVSNSSGSSADPASSIEIGSYDLKKFSSTGEILVNISAISGVSHWSCNMTVKAGNVTFADSDISVFDTTFSYIYAPRAAFNQIKNYFLNSSYGCSYQENETSVVCLCGNKKDMIGVNWYYQGVELEINKEILWYDLNDGHCELEIFAWDNPSWLLGEVFLANFYMIYDMENMVISIAPAIMKSSCALIASFAIISLLFT